MKVYFCGAHSVGKTTIARYAAEKYGFTMLNEVARLVLAERELQLNSLRADVSLVDSYQQEVFNRQIFEEKQHEHFVSDRSLIDCVAYAAQHSRISNKLVNSEDFLNYLDVLNDPDVLLFYVKPSKMTLKNDGTRENVSWDAIISIDAMIKCILELYSVKYFQINTDNMQERSRIVDAIISLKLKNNQLVTC